MGTAHQAMYLTHPLKHFILAASTDHVHYGLYHW